MSAFSFTENWSNHHGLAIFTALLETGIGIGLCFGKTKRIALYGAVFLHVVILLILGPLGHSWNEVVWPWNIAMILIVLLLFYEEEFVGILSMLKLRWVGPVLFVVWGVMPLGNIFHMWDEQLSFKMYSGAYSEGVLYGPSSQNDCLPEGVQLYFQLNEHKEREQRFILDDWSMLEMNTPPYVSDRTMKRIAKNWCNCQQDQEKSGLEILYVKRWERMAEKPFIRYSCRELLE